MNKKVDFLIAGTQKGGTSALGHYLRDHPDICMPAKKEGHFFDRKKYPESGRIDYSEYHSWFEPCRDRCLWGEKTPTYMYWNSAPRRIWNYNPDMKWILILRNPIERAFSHWIMARRRDPNMGGHADFWDALQGESARARNALPHQHRRHSYVDRGFYTEQLRRIWSFFPKDQTLVLKTEELRNSPTTTLNRVCQFLGIQPFSNVDVQSVNAQAYSASLRARERQYLEHVFEFEIRELERLLEWDCSDWLS